MNYYTKKSINFFQINTNFIFLKILIILIFTQIIIGAFVSGLDAGKIYQTWPLMNGKFLPNDYTLNELFNFNNPSFAQFIHRNIAYLIFILAIYVGILIYKKKLIKLYNSYLVLFLFILLQAILGVSILFSNVNIYFASAHQISSIFLIASSLNLYHRSISS